MTLAPSSDTGLHQTLLGNAETSEYGHLLESVVYFELLRRRNFVWVGKQNDHEIDFVTRNIDTDEVIYYQVAYTAKTDSILNREIRPLDSIDDHKQKILLTTDPQEFDHNGIKHINIINWLLDK